VPSRNPTQIRALLTSLHQAAVKGANPFARTRDAVSAWITTNARDSKQRVHVFALGKAAAAMAAGAVDALNDAGLHIAGGIAVVAAKIASDATHEQGGELPSSITVRVGDHPVPDIGSLAASDVIARTVAAVQDDDIALVLISGGATSLCAAPCAELVQAFGRADGLQGMLSELATTLHESGLTIHEMNAVRRRLLRWTAGRLAVALYERGASSIPTLAISDVIGDDPSIIGSGPCSPDPNDLASALALMGAMQLQNKVSRTLGVLLGLHGVNDDMIVPPRGDHPAFALVNYRIIARNRDACLAMADAARKEGIGSVVVADVAIEGEAETIGHTVASTAIRAASLNDGEQLVIWGGEPIVRMELSKRDVFIDDDDDPQQQGHDAAAMHEVSSVKRTPNQAHGPLGGRMQALALSASLALENALRLGDGAESSRVTVLAAGTDGRDGPTDACGAIVDANTPVLARRSGRDPAHDLAWLQSYRALNTARALLRTGPTGTNVMDVVAAYIAPAVANASAVEQVSRL
jgi:glycerate 2-kinase